MSQSLLLGCLWVVAATIVAMLPMRRQFGPGIALLIAAPVLVWFIGHQHGWILAGAGLAAVLSMFRKPLRFIFAKIRGQKPEVPK